MEMDAWNYASLRCPFTDVRNVFVGYVMRKRARGSKRLLRMHWAKFMEYELNA